MKRIIKGRARKKAIKSWIQNNPVTNFLTLISFRTGWNSGWEDCRKILFKRSFKSIEELGLTETQVINLLGKETSKDFFKWMTGQTVGLVGNTLVYYYLDVIKFIKSQTFKNFK